MAVVEPVLNVGEVPQPSVSPSGLYSVAQFVEEERPVIYGVDVPFPAVGGHGLWPEPCDPGERVKEGSESPDTVRFPGSAVWAAHECAAVGYDEASARARAQLKLRAIESVEVERHMAALLKERAVDGESLPVAESLLMAEGVQPVVHVRPQDVPALLSARYLVSVSGVVRTVLGSQVAIGAGYQTELDGVYVTGAVTIFRNAVDSYVSFDTTTNLRLAVAERPFAATWAGQAIRTNVEGVI